MVVQGTGALGVHGRSADLCNSFSNPLRFCTPSVDPNGVDVPTLHRSLFYKEAALHASKCVATIQSELYRCLTAT